MIVLVIGGILGFLAWNFTKKARKEKIGGFGTAKKKHYLDNYPGKQASPQEVLESHLEADIKDCKYKELDDKYKKYGKKSFRFVNTKNSKVAEIRIDTVNEKVESVWNPFNLGWGKDRSRQNDDSPKEYKPEDDTASYLRHKATTFWNLEIFNEDYEDIKDEDLQP